MKHVAVALFLAIVWAATAVALFYLVPWNVM
jgi:hypothetical protein